MNRYVCIHGHFYQPPRENPWLEVVEQQDSAWPFHDWNERITSECYRPNATARMLDDEGRITALVNNYARISFNVGPTLLAWMEEHAADVHDAIVAADVESADRFGGHGSAMAQVFNHAIMPLADERDRRTQVVWGIADFVRRFGRRPEGMWLAETAVDLATLELLAEQDIAFTVLSPYQAARVRPARGQWRDVSDGGVDTTQPYWVRLPSGGRISVFFYDGPTSQAVAFEGLLESGDVFAARLRGAFGERDGPQLVNIATDGESYGHHHRHGEMALAHALDRLEADPDVVLTNYAEYLARHPATSEAEVIEPSSWSCAHGVERWRGDCGCASGSGEPGWNQAWRAPLREALDWLRDELRPRYLDRARELFTDPWAARDGYIEVLLDRDRTDPFLTQHARRDLSDEERVEAIELVELQRHSLLMYTSCGWFFDEISRLEPVQVLLYAARAIQLAGQLFGDLNLHGEFLRRLEKAPSNDPMIGDGREVYELMVEPAVADLEKVAAHFAISGLFRDTEPRETFGCYDVERRDEAVSEAGRAKLAHGRFAIRSTITGQVSDYEYGVLHLGDHNIACGVRPVGAESDFAILVEELDEAFAKADFPATIRALDEHFGSHLHSLRDLFRDEQRRILRVVLGATLHEAEASYRTIYRGRAPLMRFLADLGTSIPAPLRSAADVVINAELRDAFSGRVEATHIRSLIEEASRFQVELDADGIAHALDRTIRRTGARITAALRQDDVFARFGEEEAAFFARIRTLVDVARSLPFEVDLGQAQHICYRAVHDHRPELAERAAAGDEVAARWVDALDGLADLLHVAVP